VALGVVNEQHFWSALCGELGLTGLEDIAFGERMSRGEELTEVVRGAVRQRPRDELVASLLSAGVPVAPVLDRKGMLANAPFPNFPIRLSESAKAKATAQRVPTLDQHRGQGFLRSL
jgi:crotonobetainyl-CoA:carnitine CoA-transferase CaiB-like acyl-CoA transferase